ncbi:cell division protein FtsQ/DivIB [Parahaliea mediterranea]|uniref:cell division protein FtsQ/DivIB n=1 Tax=Parahaliea mediterranea TaxID=651086 RepID=UPI000E2E9ED9|nr:cell division protein FtsQ/DivIB [Parahaliea mediterranea]
MSVRKVQDGKRRAPRKGGRGATRTAASAPRERRQWSFKVSFNWLNRLLILLGGGAVLAAGLQGYIRLQAIPVERIGVTGKLKHTQTELVQQMVQPALAGGFLNADLVQIREQLEALPWIYEASVRRRWPNSLEIHVIEQLPIARWGQGGFLNHEGMVFQTANADAWSHLPRLEGPEGQQQSMMASYQRLDELLAPLGLGVQVLAMDSRGQLSAELGNGIELQLGGNDFRERVQRFGAIYASELAPRANEVARVDLRYQSGLAVAFHEPAQVAGLASE